MRRLTSSPWGPVQQQKELAEGIIAVSTASHGGIYVDNDLHGHKIPQAIKKANFLNSCMWFEEDCDSTIAQLLFVEEIKPKNVVIDWWEKKHYFSDLAEQDLKNNHNGLYEEYLKCTCGAYYHLVSTVLNDHVIAINRQCEECGNIKEGVFKK